MAGYNDKLNAMRPYSLYTEGSLPVTVEEIKVVEAEIRCELPPDYAELLLNYGCTAFHGYVIFRLAGATARRETLNVLYGVKHGGGYDLLSNYRMYEGRMPSWLLPIAADPFGNQICLAIRGPGRGGMYFWDHEGEEEPPANTEAGESNLSLISDSLDAFISSLEFEDTGSPNI